MKPAFRASSAKAARRSFIRLQRTIPAGRHGIFGGCPSGSMTIPMNSQFGPAVPLPSRSNARARLAGERRESQRQKSERRIESERRIDGARGQPVDHDEKVYAAAQ